MLKMKRHCETCNKKLALTAEAYICSFECTFCPDCSNGTKHVCPNCKGELVRRPSRVVNPVRAAVGRISRKLSFK